MANKPVASKPVAGKPKPDLQVRGTSGLPVWGGRVYDEILKDLQGDRGRRVLREMSEQDAIVGGVLLGVEMLARQVTWSVKPADAGSSEGKKSKAEEIAEFVDGALTDMHPTWESTLSEILSMLPYGWSWLEILYKRRQGLNPGKPLKDSRYDDGKIGWRGWAIRSQETLDTWEYEDDSGKRNNDGVGELIGMWQVAPPRYERNLIPREKSLHFVTRSRRDNPEGISILRNAYHAWYMKKNIETIEGIGIERDLAGLPVLWAPEELFATDASAADKALLEMLRKIVISIKRDEQEGILMPSSFDEDKNPRYKLELLSTGGDRQFDTNSIINRYDERIAMSMLADFILMGHQAVGSFALSKTKTGLFSTALGAILDLIAAEINYSAVAKLCRLNGFPLELVPTISHGKIETADLTQVGEYLKGLSAAGMVIFPNKPLEEYLLGTAGLPSDPDMLGAGVMPLPGVGPDGLPLQGPVAPPTAGGPTPAAPVPTPARAPTATTRTSTARTTRANPNLLPKAAIEPTDLRPRRFVPLVQRVARLDRSAKFAELEPQAYHDLLDEVMSVGKFSLLSSAHQKLILAAEAPTTTDLG